MGKKRAKVFTEFFAGIGLVREGLEPSGWQCIYANDIDPGKKTMYQDRFGKSNEFHLEDIWNTESVLRHLRRRPFLATASFPCTDLSLAGHYRGLQGKHSSTFFAFLDVLKAMDAQKPWVIMIENVTGFLNSNDGRDIKLAIDSIAELGYHLDAFVLDAKWFVPQSRPRLFLLGYHERLASDLLLHKNETAGMADPWYQAVVRSGQLRPAKLRSLMENHDLQRGWSTVCVREPSPPTYDLGNYIDLDERQKWWEKDKVQKHLDMMSPLHRSRVEKLTKRKETTVGTIFRRVREGKTRSELRLDGLAGCLRTAKGGSARQIVCVVGPKAIRMRWMSPREYARLQGVEDFPISVGETQALSAFGDAVCVPAIRWIDQNVLTPIFETARIRRRTPMVLGRRA